jgi:high affinity Mn2+ porin
VLPRLAIFFLFLAAAGAQDSRAAPAQDSGAVPPQNPDPEIWNVYYQATSVGMQHGSFHALYSGPLSLEKTPEHDVSLTTTLFIGFRIKDAEFYVDPEIAGGRGFSNVNGLANSENGELPRVQSATPTPYLARAYFTYTFDFGDRTEAVESGPNQLGGTQSQTRYVINVGRFTLTDFFDGNRYSHDPRSQFVGWAAMYNGAWDYPADTRGYTWGWVHEFYTPHWAFRYASAAMPLVANGARFDRRLFVDRGDVWEVEHRHTLFGHSGAIRVLGYTNHARMGNYAEALKLAEATGGPPNVTATRKAGTLKYGTGVSWDQEIARDIGVFGRLGWNDGKTESFVFTAIDRLASGGVSVGGSRWHRKDDRVGSLFTASGISGVHALYLARGGLDFLIGDGALNYGPEMVWESYYNARLWKGFWAGPDFQRVWNPAYNRDRGPLWIEALRLHLELSRGTFQKVH